MNTKPSVEGCTSCGALFEAAPGDKGVCGACRRLLPAEPPWRSPSSPTLAGTPTPGSTKPIGAFKRPGVSSAQRPNFGRRRVLRRIVTAAVVAALLAAGLGATLSTRPRSLSDAWTALRRQTPAGAWTAIQRHASEAWVAIRRQLPFEQPVPPPPRGAIRDATPAHAGTHKRTHSPSGTTKANAAVAKRSRDDMGRAGSTP
jgi:hypothetical protein